MDLAVPDRGQSFLVPLFAVVPRIARRGLTWAHGAERLNVHPDAGVFHHRDAPRVAPSDQARYDVKIEFLWLFESCRRRWGMVDTGSVMQELLEQREVRVVRVLVIKAG